MDCRFDWYSSPGIRMERISAAHVLNEIEVATTTIANCAGRVLKGLRVQYA